MVENIQKFLSLILLREEDALFKDRENRTITGVGKIDRINGKPMEGVYHVEGLKYNL